MQADAQHLSARLATREEAHRRVTLLAIVGLMFLSVVPVFGHHLPFDSAAIMSGVQHFGAFCTTALRYFLNPVHWSFHVALAAGVGYATWDRWRAWSRLRAALMPLDASVPVEGGAIWNAAVSEGMDPRTIRVVPGLPNPAFTAGMLRPRIYVASDLASRLSGGELACVLSHEAAHVARRDPLRLSVYRFLGRVLFWIPALKRLADDMADEAEILADDRAAVGRPLVLASAILKLAGPPGTRVMEGAVAFGGSDLLDRRIRRLAGEEAAVTSHLTRRSVAGAGLALIVVLLSGAVAAGPPAGHAGESGAAHCDHGGASVLSHLFCDECLTPSPSAHCRHAM